jgi:nitroreductase
MVRSYAPEPLAHDIVERIAETVRRAPSAGYSQGQRLVVVTEPDRIAAIADVLGEEEDGEFEPWVRSAPAVVIVCTREEDYHERYRRPDKIDEQGREIEWPVPYWIFDAGAAAMLLMLAALDEGLAAGLFGCSAEQWQRLKELLSIPAEVTPVAVITVGKPAPDPRWSAVTSRRTRPRKPLDRLVHWQQWG